MLAGKPDAGNLHVRFDEGEWQDWRKPPVALYSTVRNSYGLRQNLFRDIELSGHRDMNNRGLRGGAFNNNDNNLQSSNRNNNNPTNENDNIGFRVSSLRKAAPA
jgi:formylglycine-generating enzyme required for sulfatase activity